MLPLLPTSKITFPLNYCYLPSSRRPRKSNCTVRYNERITTNKYSNELFEGRNSGVPHWALRAAVWVRLLHPIRSEGVGIPFAWKQAAAQGWRECTQLLQKSRLHAGAEIDTSDPVTGRSSNSQCRTGWLPLLLVPRVNYFSVSLKAVKLQDRLRCFCMCVFCTCGLGSM
jgi:hypothetical protein